jgi:DNA-binding GntR family transcriptional regulator
MTTKITVSKVGKPPFSPRVTAIDRRETASPSGSSLREQAYLAIKDSILTCQFQPGESIDELSVAEMLKLGRTPVHQALSRLHHEGLVNVKPRKGVIVAPLVLPEVMQVVEARILNEAHCARFAAERADARDIAALSSTLDLAKAAIAARDVKSMMNADRQFHYHLAAASKNEVLTQIVNNLSERSLRFWFISFTSDHHEIFQDQHAAILEAVRAHDGAAAEKRMQTHLGSFRKSVMRKLS